MDKDLKFDEFEPASREDWREAASASLNGESIEKRLFTTTPEGIRLKPIYDALDLESLEQGEGWPGLAPFTRGANVAGHKLESWWVAQDLASDDPFQFNELLSDELMRGRNAVVLPLNSFVRDGLSSSPGLLLNSMADLQIALKGIDLQAAPLLTWAGSSGLSLIGMLEAMHDGASWRGAVLSDPLGESLVGESFIGMDDSLNEMAKAATWASGSSCDVRTIGVRGHLWGDAGANAVDELAYTLATAVEYFKSMLERGLNGSQLREQFVFSLSLGSDVCMQIAKLRAARLIWSKALSCFGAEPAPAFIHCRSSRFNKSLLDPHSNILRATAEAFAGVVGGANSLHIAPFDEVAGGHDLGARRLARNTQLLLSDECGLGEVADAAGGSCYVETLTDQLARKAWEKFQEIEQSGGMYRGLMNSGPQQSVAKSAESRLAKIGQRREMMVGVNLSPDADERFERTERAQPALPKARASTSPHGHPGLLDSVEKIAQAYSAGASLAEVRSRFGRGDPSKEKKMEKLTFPRAAQGYEELRNNVTKYAVETGKCPSIWLAKFGQPKSWTARAEFARGFFGVGGYEIVEDIGGANTMDDALTGASKATAQVVVLCATDNEYVEIVPDFVSRLKLSNPSVYVILAGYPVDRIDEYKSLGVDEFIHMRSECLSFLQGLNQHLGVIKK